MGTEILSVVVEIDIFLTLTFNVIDEGMSAYENAPCNKNNTTQSLPRNPDRIWIAMSMRTTPLLFLSFNFKNGHQHQREGHGF